MLYKASVGLLGLAVVALLIGWMGESNPLTFAAMALTAVALVLLVLSIRADRRRPGDS